jgi:hypothetical protein
LVQFQRFLADLDRLPRPGSVEGVLVPSRPMLWETARTMAQLDSFRAAQDAARSIGLDLETRHLFDLGLAFRFAIGEHLGRPEIAALLVDHITEGEHEVWDLVLLDTVKLTDRRVPIVSDYDLVRLSYDELRALSPAPEMAELTAPPA